MREQLKTFWTGAVLVIFSTIGFLAIVSLAAGMPHWGDKQPEWLAAFGTIAAFTGTIWIATFQTRRADAESLLRARLYASGITLSISDVRGRLSFAMRELEKVIENPHAANFDAYRFHLNLPEIWKVEELMPLAPLPDNCATKLAQAGDQLANAVSGLNAGLMYDNSVENRKKIAEELLPLLTGTARMLDEAIQTCHEAAQALLKT